MKRPIEQMTVVETALVQAAILDLMGLSGWDTLKVAMALGIKKKYVLEVWNK